MPRVVPDDDPPDSTQSQLPSAGVQPDSEPAGLRADSELPSIDKASNSPVECCTSPLLLNIGALRRSAQQTAAQGASARRVREV